MYRTADFDYYLPPELIAQKPAKPRDRARLLLLDKKKKSNEKGAFEHKRFDDIVDRLHRGDVLVLNNSKVFPARLLGHKQETGGAVEIFLHKKMSGGTKTETWECLVGGRVKEGLAVKFLKSSLEAVITKNNNDGTWLVIFNLAGDRFFKAIEKIGLVPLPPYIKRGRKVASDRTDYQTVFADPRKIGSAAAPTAGLHFTKRLLDKIKTRGVKIAVVTLHVGLGTFAPVKTENILEHKMHSEYAEISGRTAKTILAAKKAGGRVIAVGTTSCRTLESADWDTFRLQFGRQAARKADSIKTQSFWTEIFIYPGYKFRITDALITNFHLPKSTLLMLVSALAGKDHIDEAYRRAVAGKYRFFSYGDAMFIS